MRACVRVRVRACMRAAHTRIHARSYLRLRVHEHVRTRVPDMRARACDGGGIPELVLVRQAHVLGPATNRHDKTVGSQLALITLLISASSIITVNNSFSPTSF